ncbi:unnamed protein product [Symbiodinium sp. CCMP2456]|nr:unnamed protein product [Symbiodinium sp. CCMP2456]
MSGLVALEFHAGIPVVPIKGIHGTVDFPLLGIGTWQYNSTVAKMAVAVAKIPKQRRSVAFAEEPSSPPPRLSESELLHRMTQNHESMVRGRALANSETIAPFAEECQKRLESLHGWESHGIDFNHEATEEVKVEERFLLPTSSSQFPVTVLDGVLRKEMCESFISIHEKVGFARPPSLLVHLAEKNKLEEEDEEDLLLKLAYEQAKNTSELVQIESVDFADYLWKKLEQFLPDEHRHVGNFTSGVYEKCGIVPVFRFMRYQRDQGFKPHKDPERAYAEYPLRSGAAAAHGESGIYKSFFTIALYLNDPAEFEGGKLNFVQIHVDDVGDKTYESQATVNPAVGRCVLFAHNELHEGGGVQSGTKYMCQCDVLYKRVRETVISAFSLGYRHVDTASVYQNQKGVGAAAWHFKWPINLRLGEECRAGALGHQVAFFLKALAEMKMERDEFFVTSKIPGDGPLHTEPRIRSPSHVRKMSFCVCLALLFCLLWQNLGDLCEEERAEVMLLQSQLRVESSGLDLRFVGRSFFSTDPVSTAGWWLRYSTSHSLNVYDLPVMGLVEAEAAAAVQITSREGNVEQLYFLKAPSWRSDQNLTMEDFVRAAEMSWATVMDKKQLYTPWTDYHDGHRVETMRIDNFQADRHHFQNYVPLQTNDSAIRIIRDYIPNTTWTMEWFAGLGSSMTLPLDYMDTEATADPDACRKVDRLFKKNMWWKSTFAVTNASIARDFAIRILGATPASDPFPWPPNRHCIAAQWVTLPYSGPRHWKALQLHFVEDPVYRSTLHGIPAFQQYQQEFMRSHTDCINSFMLNNLVLKAESLDPFIKRLSEASTSYFVSQVRAADSKHDATYALIFSFPGNEGVTIQIRSAHVSAASPTPFKLCV